MNPFSPLYRIPRLLAVIAAWATCLSPMLVEAKCCCVKELAPVYQTTVLQVPGEVAGAPALQKSCCRGSHGSHKNFAAVKSTQSAAPDLLASGSGAGSHSKKDCECTLSCCQPEMLVLASAPNFAEREWVGSPAHATLYSGSVDGEEFAAGGAIRTDVGRIPATDSISYCALLCRWRN